MKEKLRRFFAGRQGMDELSKLLFWVGLGLQAVSIPAALALPGLGSLLSSFGLVALIFSFVRALSRNLPRRETENGIYLRWREGQREKRRQAQERRAQKDYRFFQCPGCGAWLRVPRGKGKIHINCKCGYTLYRKT